MFHVYEPEVIYVVLLSNGKTLRGMFEPDDKSAPRGWASLDLYQTDQDQPERWVHLNPAHIVSIQIWND